MNLHSNRVKTKTGAIIFLQIFVLTLIITGFNLAVLPATEIPRNVSISTQDATTGYEHEWTVTYGTPLLDRGNGLTIDSTGCIYLAGDEYDAANGNYDAFFAKYNWTGELLLNITYNHIYNSTAQDDRCYGIAVNSTGFIFLVGSISDTGLSGTTQDGFFLQYDSLGVPQPKSFLIGSSTGDDVFNDVIVDANDNVYFTGRTHNSSHGYQLYLRKYLPHISPDWTAYFGGAGSEEGFGIAVDSSSNVYVVGTTDSWGAGSTDAWMLKYNSGGTKQWNVTWGSTGAETGRDIVVDGTNCLAMGTTPWYFGTTFSDFHFSRFAQTNGASSGWEAWRGPIQDYGYGIAKDSNGSFFLCGSTWTGANLDAVIVKYNSSYDRQWNLTMGTPDLLDEAKEIALDSRDNIYIVGNTESYGAGVQDAFLAKYGLDPDTDGLTNDEENFTYGTNSTDPDSDDDGYTDGAEVSAGTDPTDPNDYPSTGGIPGFQIGYILLGFLLILGVLMFLTKSKNLNKITP